MQYRAANIANMQTNPATELAPLDVQLLWLPDAMPGTVFAAIDVLNTAGGILQMRNPQRERPLTWRVITPPGVEAPLSAGAMPLYTKLPAQERAPERTLIVVPALGTRNAPHLGEIVERHPEVLTMLHDHALRGGLIAACYTGMAFLARLGLLNNARCAPPWAYQSWMKHHYPDGDFATDEPMSFHESIATCTAPALQTEFISTLLGRLLHADITQACMQVLNYQQRRQQITSDLAGAWLTTTADSPVYRATQWLQANLEQPYNLQTLAMVAATSERTLLRHFQQAVGMSPLDYLHKLRVERAKVMMEVSLHNFHTIASACGYSDANSFRRLFQQATGMNPSVYRERFTLRARRAHWKVEQKSERALAS
ncbi:MAG TPA: helix-turn-helix domain-containing protein [Duganella sp.]|nr:helix-turn-helix domain-containing protein [Duganella sp.]